MPFYPDLDLTGPCVLCLAEPGERCINIFNGREITQRTHQIRSQHQPAARTVAAAR